VYCGGGRVADADNYVIWQGGVALERQFERRWMLQWHVDILLYRIWWCNGSAAGLELTGWMGCFWKGWPAAQLLWLVVDTIDGDS